MNRLFHFYLLCAHQGDPAMSILALLLELVQYINWTLYRKGYFHILRSNVFATCHCAYSWEVACLDLFCYIRNNILIDCSNKLSLHPLLLLVSKDFFFNGTPHTSKITFYYGPFPPQLKNNFLAFPISPVLVFESCHPLLVFSFLLYFV